MGELVRFENTEWAAIQANWEQLKGLALQGVSSAHTRRSYNAALGDWNAWYGAAAEPRPRFFSKACVNGFRSDLEARGLSSSSINVRLAAVRKLASEAADNGLIAPEMAAGIGRVKGSKRLGTRLGNWLNREQAEQLIGAPDASTLTGKRDRALLGMLIGCGLRRSEVCSLTVEHVQQREGRWVLVDLTGKGGRIRSVPMPAWSKALLDCWTDAASITTGPVFRPINRGGHVHGERLNNAHSIWLALGKYAGAVGVANLAPHDLRRTFAKLAHTGHASIEQIQLSLGHASIQTTERYLGVRQSIQDAPCDHLGIGVA